MPKRRKDIAKGLAVFLFGQKEKKKVPHNATIASVKSFAFPLLLGKL